MSKKEWLEKESVWAVVVRHERRAEGSVKSFLVQRGLKAFSRSQMTKELPSHL
jgi:hypothetical protein